MLNSIILYSFVTGALIWVMGFFAWQSARQETPILKAVAATAYFCIAVGIITSIVKWIN